MEKLQAWLKSVRTEWGDRVAKDDKVSSHQRKTEATIDGSMVMRVPPRTASLRSNLLAKAAIEPLGLLLASPGDLFEFAFIRASTLPVYTKNFKPL